jgi:hypothetical protein
MFALLRLFIIGAFGSLLIAMPAKAAEVTCIKGFQAGGSCFAALLSGTIAKGDYEKVALLYASSHPRMSYLYLQSPGGEVEDAIKIGRLLRRYLITAMAPSFMRAPEGTPALLLPNYFELHLGFDPSICSGSSCICASACALIWFGAPQRDGTVGLHRPHFANSSFKDLSPALAAQAYRPVLQHVASYLEEMETPKPVIDTMIATGSSEVKWYEQQEPEDRAPSFAEWQDAACGGFGKDKYDVFLSLMLYARKNCRAQNADAYCIQYNALNEERIRRERCIDKLIASSQEMLPPPDVQITTSNPPKSDARLTPSGDSASKPYRGGVTMEELFGPSQRPAPRGGVTMEELFGKEK